MELTESAAAYLAAIETWMEDGPVEEDFDAIPVVLFDKGQIYYFNNHLEKARDEYRVWNDTHQAYQTNKKIREVRDRQKEL